jgi:GAF domain-containing protein
MVSGTSSEPERAALHDVFLPDVPLTDLLDRVTELAVRTIPSCSFAGITLSEKGLPVTPVYTDPRSPRVDQVQYDNDTGPCLDAMRDGEVYRIDDTATHERWRPFCEAANAEGILSTLSLPLLVSSTEDALGALNLYSEERAAFQEAFDAAASFAYQAAIVLANAQAYWGARELSTNLQLALESRATIEQAKGILIAQSGVDPDEAFQLLVRASQRTNKKLREVAAELVQKAIKPKG